MTASYRRPGLPGVGGSRAAADEINPVRVLAHSPGFGLFTLALVHPLLAFAMRASSLVATVHALMTIALGLAVALFGRDVRKAGYVVAYIAGAEVLWRMTDARIFWEAGKYSTILILLVALFRIKPWQRAGLPLLYFCLLCVSIPLTLLSLGFSGAARDAISFNLSGPLALMICALYFSQMNFDQDAIRRLMGWIVLPVLGISTLTVYGIVSVEQIVFADESNFATSGGYGPNQVSAILGLGGALFLLFFLMGNKTLQRLLCLGFSFGLLVLSALTFSRGGMYNAAIMMALALAHYLRGARGRLTVISILLITGFLGSYLIFPRLNAYTGGMLGQRFSSLDSTSRDLMARADLSIWVSHPLLGVGPGLSKSDRISFLGSGVAAHTEYTRLLAEHGTAGLLALALMLIMSVRAYLRAPGLEAQAWVAALLAWPLMEMSHAAMRVVAISFLFGLAMVNWDAERRASRAAENGMVER